MRDTEKKWIAIINTGGDMAADQCVRDQRDAGTINVTKVEISRSG